MFLNFTAFMERETPAPAVFGLEISRLESARIVDSIVSNEPVAAPGARLFLPLGMRHVASMRRDPELEAMVETAELVTCAETPVLHYASMRGCALPGVVTAREVTGELLRRVALDGEHRLFLIVEREATATMARAWAAQYGVQVSVAVAPASFGDDRAGDADLVEQVAAFDTTILLLGMDAPHGEGFVARQRERLPDGCWALCVGQALDEALAAVWSDPAIDLPVIGRKLRRIGSRLRQVGRQCVATPGFVKSIYREMNASSARAVRVGR